MQPERSLSYCWKSALHRCIKSHSAEKPNRSIRPDRVLSNMSSRENKIQPIQLKQDSDNGRQLFLQHSRAKMSSLFFCMSRSEQGSPTFCILVRWHINPCLANTTGMWTLAWLTDIKMNMVGFYKASLLSLSHHFLFLICSPNLLLPLLCCRHLGRNNVEAPLTNSLTHSHCCWGAFGCNGVTYWSSWGRSRH